MVKQINERLASDLFGSWISEKELCSLRFVIGRRRVNLGSLFNPNVVDEVWSIDFKHGSFDRCRPYHLF